MSNTMTPECQETIRNASQMAVALRQDELDSVALVAAMLANPGGVAARSLARFSISTENFLATARPGVTLVTGGAAKPTALSADVRRALESAAREAGQRHHLQVTSGHVLLALTGQDCAAARALGALGATPELVRAAVLETTPAGTRLRHIIAEVPLPPPPPGALPARTVGLRTMVGLVLAYAAAAALAVLTVTPPDLREVAGGAFVLIALIDVFMLVVLGGVAASRASRYLTAHAPTVVELPPVAVEVAARYGVRRLEARVRISPLVRARAYRAGRRASIIITTGHLLSPGRIRFTLAHEMGHVLRADSRRRRFGLLLSLAMLVIPLIDPRPLTIAVTLLAAIGVDVGDRWLAEFAADAVAVRWVGIHAVRTFAAEHRRLRAMPQNRTARWRLRRVLGPLTHPPLAWRLARAEAIARRATPGPRSLNESTVDHAGSRTG